jgi:hypothetical protein
LALIAVVASTYGVTRLGGWLWLAESVLIGLTTIGLIAYVASDDPYGAPVVTGSRWERQDAQGATVAAVVLGGVAVIAAIGAAFSVNRRWLAIGTFAVAILALGWLGFAFIVNSVD